MTEDEQHRGGLALSRPLLDRRLVVGWALPPFPPLLAPSLSFPSCHGHVSALPPFAQVASWSC